MAENIVFRLYQEWRNAVAAYKLHLTRHKTNEVCECAEGIEAFIRVQNARKLLDAAFAKVGEK